MGNTTSEPLDSSKLAGSLILESIQFRKYWDELEEKYQLSALSFKTSHDMPSNYYYHDLLCSASDAPFFEQKSLLTSCIFVRDSGEWHRYRGIWEGEVKPSDTVKYTHALPTEVKVHVDREEELGTYIRDESKCKRLNAIKALFIPKERFSGRGASLSLEVTLDKFRRYKSRDTPWTVYTLHIPCNTLQQALDEAKVCVKPKIVEAFSKKNNAKPSPPKAITYNLDRDDAKQPDNDHDNDTSLNQNDELAHYKQKAESLEMENKTLRIENEKLKQLLGIKKQDGSGYELNLDEFESWDHVMVVRWILSLENGRFLPYKEVLSNILAEEKVKGTDLYSVEAKDVKDWGISAFADKKRLFEHIQSLIQRNDTVQVEGCKQ